MTETRSRPIKLDDGRSGLELQFERLVAAAQLPEPIRELRFEKGCCAHRAGSHPMIGRLAGFCVHCDDKHEYVAARRWRFDFAWPERKLAVEIDGAVHSGGRHTRGAGYEADIEKMNAAVLAGWRVLRFTSGQLDSGYALETLEKALK